MVNMIQSFIIAIISIFFFSFFKTPDTTIEDLVLYGIFINVIGISLRLSELEKQFKE